MSEYADQYNYLFFSFASLLSSSFPFFPSPFSFLFFSSSRKKYTPFTECTFLPFDPNAHGIVHSAPWRVQLAGNRLTTRKSIKLRISLKEFASASLLSFSFTILTLTVRKSDPSIVESSRNCSSLGTTPSPRFNDPH